MYDDIIDDPKILKLSPEFRWFYVGILSVSSRQSVRGSLPKTSDIALHLRTSEAKTRKIIDRLIGAGLIEQDPISKRLSVHGWDRRQFRSDDVTQRWREHKQRKGANVGQTLAPTDQIQIQNQKQTPLPPDWGAGVSDEEPFDPGEVLPTERASKPPGWTPQHQAVLDRNAGRFGVSNGDRVVADLLRDYSPQIVAAACNHHYADTGGRINGKQLLGICKAMHAGTWKLPREPDYLPTTAAPPTKTDEQLRAETAEANRKYAEYQERQRAKTQSGS